MPTIVTTCRECGAEFEPTHDAIVAGTWRTCPICRPPPASEQPASPTRCDGCGRVLRAGTRTLRYTCLTGGSGL
jgi:hypothetical protein